MWVVLLGAGAITIGFSYLFGLWPKSQVLTAAIIKYNHRQPNEKAHYR
jgi:hypothetical protein